ncbi:MAG: hypothetical protein ACOZE5_04230 [Verrucomicrobiota bacterium]
MKPLLGLLCVAGLLLTAARAQSAAPTSNWLERLHLTATGAASAINNLSRTSHEPTRQDAETYELSLASTHARQLAPNILLVATGEAGSLTVPAYELTDSLRFTGRLALQRKFGLGPQAPVLQFSAGATYKAARFGGDRGWTTEAGVQLAKRVRPNLRLAARADWLEHDARSATFDLNQHSFGLDARWDLNDRWALSGSAARLSGDIVANAAWPIWGMALGGGFGPTVQQYYRSRPWTTTHLYGPGWVSYNVEADVDLWSAALGYAFTDRTSLELRKSAAYVVNALGIAYPTDSWGLSLTHRF